MLTVPLLWLSKAFNFFAYRKTITVTMMTLTEDLIFAKLSKIILVFYVGRHETRHSIAIISNVFSKSNIDMLNLLYGINKSSSSQEQKIYF